MKYSRKFEIVVPLLVWVVLQPVFKYIAENVIFTQLDIFSKKPCSDFLYFLFCRSSDSAISLTTLLYILYVILVL